MLWKKTPWWVVAAIGVVVVGSLGVPTTLSYLKTAWRGVGKTIREATPIAFDLERLNSELKDLEPEIRRNQAVVAQLEVETENLEEEIAQMEQEQSKAVAEMRKLRELIRENKSQYELGGRTYDRDDLEAYLARRLDRYEVNQQQLEAKKQLLVERRRHLEAAKAKVNTYRQQYEQLKIKAEALAAQLKAVEAARKVGTVEVDHSRLARAQELAKEIEKRIRVAQRLLENEQTLEGEIPVNVDTRPASERFDEMFGEETEQSAAEDSETR